MSISISIDGQEYTQWTESSCERDLENMSGTFDFTLSAQTVDGEGYPYPKLQPDSEIIIKVDGQLFLTGTIDKREDEGDADSYKLSVSGRSKTRNAIDSSADHVSGEFNKQTPKKIIETLAGKNDLGFTDESTGKEVNIKHRVFESETTARSIQRVARESGKIITDDEEGNLVAIKAGSKGQGSPLVLGQNVYKYSVSQDWSKRVKKVQAKGQSISTDEKYGKAATDNGAESIDQFVKGARQLRILTDSDQDVEKLKKRALSEVRRRAGQSLSVTVTVHTHTDPQTGTIWTLNKTHEVIIPRADINATLLAKKVKFIEKSDDLTAELELTPKGALSTDKDDDDGDDKGSKVFDSTGSLDLGKTIE